MSMHPQPIPVIPEETAYVARAVLPQGNVWMQMRDELGTLYEDQDFADLFPSRGQPAEAPWRLALAACRRERSSGHVGCFVSACVLHSTGGSDSMEHGRRRKTVGDRERAGCKHVVAPALHSR